MQPNGFPVRPFSLINKPTGGVCPIGYKNFYPLVGYLGHNGTDFAAFKREPTYHAALFRGVAIIPTDADAGIYVLSNDAIKACEAGCPAGTMHHVMLRYAHGTPAIKAGTPVGPGDLVQYADSIGSGTAVHVHFGPKYSDAKGTILHTDNGYGGVFAIDEVFENVFILDYLHTLLKTTDPVIPPAAAAQLPDHIPPEASLSYLQKMSSLLHQLSLRLAEWGLMHNGAGAAI